MTKKARQEVFEKYDGKCAYTGKPLGVDWQIDHMKSRFLADYHKHTSLSFNEGHITNLMPTLRIVNHYKRALDLEGFRKYMMSFHLRLAKLPKNTQIPRTTRRKEYMYKVADAFEIAIDKPFNGVFYFETINRK